MNINLDVNSNSIADTVRQAFDFKVGKYPLFGVDNMPTPLMGLFREDTYDYVGKTSVTNRYEPHTTDDVIALCESAANAFQGEVRLKCHWNDGHYVSIAPTEQYRQSIYGTTDNIFPRVLIRAGYAGKSFQASLGYYRDLCRNMAMLDSVSNCCVNIKHTHSLRTKIDDLIDDMRGLSAGWDNLTNVIERMESRRVGLAEFLASVYGSPEENSQRSESVHRNRAIAIYRRVARERTLSGRPVLATHEPEVSAWEAFNAVQGYAQHEASRKRKPSEFDRMLLGLNDKYVSIAESLALSV
jgi:hypothetical protein